MTPNLTKLAESLEWQPIADANAVCNDGQWYLTKSDEWGNGINSWKVSGTYEGFGHPNSDYNDTAISGFMPLPTGEAGGIIRVLVEALERMRNENSDPCGIAKYALQRAEQLAANLSQPKEEI